MANLLKADGTVTTVEPKNGKNFGLAELQGFVGGYIEILVPRGGRRGMVLVINEEGKLEAEPTVNAKASGLYGVPHDPVVGDVLYCASAEVD